MSLDERFSEALAKLSAAVESLPPKDRLVALTSVAVACGRQYLHNLEGGQLVFKTERAKHLHQQIVQGFQLLVTVSDAINHQ